MKKNGNFHAKPHMDFDLVMINLASKKEETSHKSDQISLLCM